MDMLDKWDRRFCDLAQNISGWSKDPNTKIGAVIVGDNKEIISLGYNGIPRGVEDNIESRNKRENNEKYYWYEHAERNAIYNAVRVGACTMNTSLYLNCSMPCCDCTRAIIQAGINNITCKKEINMRELWKEHGKRSIIMLTEAGIKINFY